MSNSLVNSLLHVLEGLIKDASLAYPALKEGFLRDYARIALHCQSKGLEAFTLDLPHLESLLLRGLEEGHLVLEGPLSTRVSKRTLVPRLFSGLWLCIFDKDASLKREVDPTALAFLRQLLVLGKKLEVECSRGRIEATVGAYHGIERRLRRPGLDWSGDELGVLRAKGGDCYHPLFGVGRWTQLSLFSQEASSFEAEEEEKSTVTMSTSRIRDPMKLNLVQAVDYHPDDPNASLPLFRDVCHGEEAVRESRVKDTRLLYKIQQVADLICGSFDTLDPVGYSAYLEQRGLGIGFKHGPGAVAERLKNWEKTQFPNWPRKLQGTFPFEYCGSIMSRGILGDRPPNHEVASRLLAVPKTSKGPRLIAAEPTSHQWCQQLVMKYFFDQCRQRFGVNFIDRETWILREKKKVHIGTNFLDFKNQTLSGDLVLKASLDRSLATVDLSDASDRLTCWTVERMFRANSSILIALHAARTRYLRDEVSGDIDFLELRKFASQGTATTFPVMSLVMLFIALGATLFEQDEDVTWRNIRKYRDQVRVFGDDIILPVHGYVPLLRAMELLQLKVNTSKSYWRGNFRESCGVDGFAGYDVTPLKPKRIVADSPASCQAVVDNSNNLFLKGYWNASTAMFDLLPARLRRGIRIVGPHDAGFRGVASYSGGYELHLKTRWNSRLHRHEARVWTLSVRTEEHPRDGLSALLDFFASKHNHEHARIVSQYADVRKTRIGLLWEPTNTDARVTVRLPGQHVGRVLP